MGDRGPLRRPAPALGGHGAQLVADVAPFELAKLRKLNGAHRGLAYTGLRKGHAFAHEVVAGGCRRAIIHRCLHDRGGKGALWPGYGELADALAGGA